MRVLHVISSIDPRAGGPSTALEDLAIAQLAVGLDVRVLATFDRDHDNSIEQSLRSRGVKVQVVGPSQGRLKRHPQLAQTVAAAVADADVVHIHALWEEIQHQAALAARKRQVPYFFLPHGMLDPWSLSQRRLIKSLYLLLRLRKDLNHAVAIQYTTDAEKRLASRLELKAPGIIVPYCVKLPAADGGLAGDNTLTREALDLPANAFVISHFGRLHMKKGIEVSIRALAQFPAENRPHFLVIGPGDADYAESLAKLARELKLDAFVHFLGMQGGDRKHQALKLTDLFVLPSFQENFGISVVDAMALELPVVISDQVNLCDAVRTASAGKVLELYPIDSAPQRLARDIRYYMEHREEAAKAGRNGREYAAREFDCRHIAARWRDYYAKAVEKRPLG